MQKLCSIFTIICIYLFIGCSDSCNCPNKECNNVCTNTVCDTTINNEDSKPVSDQTSEQNEEQDSTNDTGEDTGEDTDTDTGTTVNVEVVTNSEPAPFTGIVGFHNTYRKQVGLSDLKWSDTIAESAQEWADYLGTEGNCRLIHSNSRYGENLAASSYPLTSRQIVKMWADEAQWYNCETGSCQTGKVCGHYTQVVWSSTKEVGCGWVSCSPWNIYVCQYSPPGNYYGQIAYECE